MLQYLGLPRYALYEFDTPSGFRKAKACPKANLTSPHLCREARGVEIES